MSRQHAIANSVGGSNSPTVPSLGSSEPDPTLQRLEENSRTWVGRLASQPTGLHSLWVSAGDPGQGPRDVHFVLISMIGGGRMRGVRVNIRMISAAQRGSAQRARLHGELYIIIIIITFYLI